MRTFTGLSQYPVFKVQAAADSLLILRFCPLLATLVRSAARRYITQSRLPCQRVLGTFFGSLSIRFLRPLGENQSALRAVRRALTRQHVGRVYAVSGLLCEHLRSAIRFQHALRSLVLPGRCGRRNIASARAALQGLSRRFFSNIPKPAFRATRPCVDLACKSAGAYSLPMGFAKRRLPT